MTTGSELSCVACYLRADHDDLRARLERPVGRLNTLGSGGGPCEVALEPGWRADEQIARVRFAVVGERVSDVARSERELAGAPRRLVFFARLLPASCEQAFPEVKSQAAVPRRAGDGVYEGQFLR